MLCKKSILVNTSVSTNNGAWKTMFNMLNQERERERERELVTKNQKKVAGKGLASSHENKPGLI